MKSIALTAALALSFASSLLAQAPQAVLLPTPQMGWNSWNLFQVNIDEKLIKGVADAMIANGMRDAGYVYVNLDDGWSEKQRTADGELVGDKKRFPSGMKALGDYLHERGFKFGIYNCCGTQTCAGYPGTKDHEEQDMKTYASWGVDYFKCDWCHTEGMSAPDAYTRIHEAIEKCGRPIVLSLCEWGGSKPWEWAGKGIGQSWRTTGDIGAKYEGTTEGTNGWKNILDKQVGLESFAGPGHWNDPDMLEVGNEGLTFEESRAHFSFWCILAAPLIAGNDVRSMNDSVKTILTNKDAIAINQDALGKEGTRVIHEADREVWIKPLSSESFAVCLLNSGKSDSDKIELKWSEIPQLKGSYAVHDIWGGKDVGDTSSDISGALKSHDVKLFKLTPLK